MPIVASSQLTLTDVYDSKQLSLYIRPTRQTTIIFDADGGFAPDYTGTPLRLVPEITALGQSELLTNNISSCVWTVQRDNETEAPIVAAGLYGLETIGTGALEQLVISANPLMAHNIAQYSVTISYLDPVLGETLTVTGSLDLTKILNGRVGEDAVTLNLTNDSASLSAAWDGTVSDYSSMHTRLEVLSGSTSVTSDWVITAVPQNGVTGTFTSPSYQVAGMENDDGSVVFTATKGPLVYTKTFSVSKIRRGEDAYRVEIISSQGNLFKNGIVSTELSAMVYRGDEDITASTGVQHFIWKRTSADLAADAIWNADHAGGAKTITITPTDVTVRATFNCKYTNA